MDAAASPARGRVLHFFGVLPHQTRRSAGARLIEKSIALDPALPTPTTTSERPQGAGSARRALASWSRHRAAPAYADAHNNAATILRAQDRLMGARGLRSASRTTRTTPPPT